MPRRCTERLVGSSWCLLLSSLIPFKRGLPPAQRTQLLGELVGELGEPLRAQAHELELPLDERNGCLDDPGARSVVRGLGPLVPECGAGLFCLGERDDLLEREPE